MIALVVFDQPTLTSIQNEFANFNFLSAPFSPPKKQSSPESSEEKKVMPIKKAIAMPPKFGVNAA